jgi:hypothetical protein
MTIDLEGEAVQELGFLLAEAPSNVVFVVGAGLSMPAGLPSWGQLLQEVAKSALTALNKKGRFPAAEAANKQAIITDPNSSPWVVFDQLRKVLGGTEYEASVARQLTPAARTHPPEAYDAIWKLRPSGMINFNLDRLAEQSLSATEQQVATPAEEGRYRAFLLAQKPFVFQPHGRIASPNTWVLGLEARNKLLKNTTYRRWMANVLASRRLVIVGFGPKDFSFELLLMDDFREEIDGVGHFWIAHAPTPHDLEWARENRIKVISYKSNDGTHSEVTSLLRHLATYRPRSPLSSTAYSGASISPDELPSDDELRKSSMEDIRRRINAAMKYVFDHSAPEERAEKSKQLFARFSMSTNSAWHTASSPPANMLWGYKLLRDVGSGGFATVWEARDVVDGTVYAIKVLDAKLRNQSGFLEAFRRGVEANRILSEAKLTGMVRYERAFDVPACVVMEFVKGETLEAIVTRNGCGFDELLRILLRTAEIIANGHALDKNVLHRDLKPANIMLRTSSDSLEERVVVLDFDLSWYEGAIGRSVISSRSMHNYIAPEQLAAKKRYSARHTAVDVFGLGMLAYYVSTGEHPSLNAQNAAGFFEQVAGQAVANRAVPKSVGHLLAATVVDSTVDSQPERISVSVFRQRLHLALECVLSEKLDESGVLVVLELAFVVKEDGWNADLATTLHDGRALLKKDEVVLLLQADSESGTWKVSAKLTYAGSGTDDRSRVRRYGEIRRDRAVSALKDGAWAVRRAGASATVAIEAQVACIDWTKERNEQASASLLAAARALAFSPP